MSVIPAGCRPAVRFLTVFLLTVCLLTGCNRGGNSLNMTTAQAENAAVEAVTAEAETSEVATSETGSVEAGAIENETDGTAATEGNDPATLMSDASNLSLSSVSDWRREKLNDLSIWNGKWYFKGDTGAAYIKIENGVAELSEDVYKLQKFCGKISAEIRKETHPCSNMDVDSESLVLTVDCGGRKVEFMNICCGEALLNKESEAFFFPEEMCVEGELSEVYPECVLMSTDFEQLMRNDKAYFLPDGLLILSGFSAGEQNFENNAVGTWSANTSEITVKYFDGTEETFEFDPYGDVHRFYLDYTGSDYIG